MQLIGMLTSNMIETMQLLTHEVEESGVFFEPEIHETNLNEFTQRKYLSPETLLEIAEAFWVFASLDLARLYADSALSLDPLLIEELVQSHDALRELLGFLEETNP